MWHLENFLWQSFEIIFLNFGANRPSPKTLFRMLDFYDTREIYTKNLRAVTRYLAQLCEIARNYAYIFGINFPGTFVFIIIEVHYFI